jgi:hypothetical protein
MAWPRKTYRTPRLAVGLGGVGIEYRAGRCDPRSHHSAEIDRSSRSVAASTSTPIVLPVPLAPVNRALTPSPRAHFDANSQATIKPWIAAAREWRSRAADSVAISAAQVYPSSRQHRSDAPDHPLGGACDRHASHGARTGAGAASGSADATMLTDSIARALRLYITSLGLRHRRARARSGQSGEGVGDRPLGC